MKDDAGDGTPPRTETFGSWLQRQIADGATVVSVSSVVVDGTHPRIITLAGERTIVDLPRLDDSEPLTAEMIRHFNQSLWLDEDGR